MTKKYVFFDESGDLGLATHQANVSSNFYVTFLVTDRPKEIDKVVKKVVASIKKTRGHLHANREKQETISRLLRYLSRKEISIYVLVIEKDKLPLNYRRLSKKNLYAEFCSYLIDKLPRSVGYDFVAVRYFVKKTDNEKFISKIVRNNLSVSIERPCDNRCLQAVDFVAYAINRKYETGDTNLVDIIKNRIKKEIVFDIKQHPRSLSGRTPSGPDRGNYLYGNIVSKKKGPVK